MHSAEDAAQVFDAAVPFARRLLLPHAGEDDPGPYRGVALAVLASLGAQPELASRAEFSACACAAAPLLLDPSLSSEALPDLITVVDALLRRPDGLADPVHGALLSTVVSTAASRTQFGPSRTGGPMEATEAACALLEGLGATHGQPALLSVRDAVAAELISAVRVLAPAVATCTDTLALRRLRALRALLEAVLAQRLPESDVADVSEAAHAAAAQAVGVDSAAAAAGSSSVAAAVRDLAPELRSALSVPLASKLTPEARADVLRATACATALCGPGWLLDRLGGGGGALATGSLPDGTLLSLLLQLSSVELQMCLHDQPGDQPMSDEARATLAACCSLIEEALFRLHSDYDEDEDDEGGEEASGGGDPWLNALSDEQVISAQSAFQRAVMASLEFVEALRTEEAEARRNAAQPTADTPPIHPLLPPVARLLSAWLAQPSASTLMETYDRACSLLPMLQGAVASESGAWAGHLRDFERAEREPPDGGLDPDDAVASEETMSELFSRLMPQGGMSPEEMARRMGAMG